MPKGPTGEVSTRSGTYGRPAHHTTTSEVGLCTYLNQLSRSALANLTKSDDRSYSTTSNGPNHINYIANARGANNVVLNKFAYPGAVTDSRFAVPTQVLPGFSPIINWNDQINEIVTAFTAARTAGTASARDSLFIFLASNTGNDILGTYNTTTNQAQTINNLIGVIRTKFAQVNNSNCLPLRLSRYFHGLKVRDQLNQRLTLTSHPRFTAQELATLSSSLSCRPSSFPEFRYCPRQTEIRSPTSRTTTV